MDEQKIKDRLRKLYELAARGEGGEAANARIMLDRLMSQHGMTLADVASETREAVKLTWRDKEERQIVTQILFRLLSVPEITIYNSRGRSFWVKLTKPEAVQAKEESAALLAGYRKERKRLLRAFIHRNGIYSDVVDDEPRAALSEEELDELMRAIRMAEGMNRTPIHRMISSGGDASCS